MFRELKAINYSGVLSVELFNHTYYSQDPLVVAKTALEKLKAAIKKA